MTLWLKEQLNNHSKCINQLFAMPVKSLQLLESDTNAVCAQTLIFARNAKQRMLMSIPCLRSENTNRLLFSSDALMEKICRKANSNNSQIWWSHLLSKRARSLRKRLSTRLDLSRKALAIASKSIQRIASRKLGLSETTAKLSGLRIPCSSKQTETT